MSDHEHFYLICENKCLVESRPVAKGSVTLTAVGWSNNTQTVNVTGIKATDLIVASPDPANLEEAVECKVINSQTGAGTITFTCETVPENAIIFNFVVVK